MARHGERRAASTMVLAVITWSFVGGGGWMAGCQPEAARGAAPPAPASAAVAVEETVAHHAHHAPAPAAIEEGVAHHAHHAPRTATQGAPAHKHRGHDCEKGVCRCDSKCPPRRSGPCGGSMRSCAGGSGDEAGLGPGPGRPFLLVARVLPVPVFDSFDRPDVRFARTTRAQEPFSPPPRSTAL